MDNNEFELKEIKEEVKEKGINTEPIKIKKRKGVKYIKESKHKQLLSEMLNNCAKDKESIQKQIKLLEELIKKKEKKKLWTKVKDYTKDISSIGFIIYIIYMISSGMLDSESALRLLIQGIFMG